METVCAEHHCSFIFTGESTVNQDTSACKSGIVQRLIVQAALAGEEGAAVIMIRLQSDAQLILTLLLDLADLLHRLFEDGTFVGLDVEVVHVVNVRKYQLGQLFDVLVFLLPVPPLSVPLWTVEETSTLSELQ